MADEKTGPDALWAYLTGASADGGTQATPDSSTGKYRSSSTAEWQSAAFADVFANLTVDFVAPENGTGTGVLYARTVDTLLWTPPSEEQGTAVTIANGETKLITGHQTDRAIRVSRTSAADLVGAMAVTIMDQLNNLGGCDNVTSAQAGTGIDEPRCVCLKNESSGTITGIKVFLGVLGSEAVADGGQLGASGAGTITTTDSFADWPDAGWARIEQADTTLREIAYYTSRTATALTVPSAGRAQLGTSASAGAATDWLYSVPGLRIAVEAPSGQPAGQFTDGSGGIPGGLTWYTPIRSVNGVSIATLATTNIYGVWLRRTLPAGAKAVPVAWNSIRLRYAT